MFLARDPDYYNGFVLFHRVDDELFKLLKHYISISTLNFEDSKSRKLSITPIFLCSD